MSFKKSLFVLALAGSTAAFAEAPAVPAAGCVAPTLPAGEAPLTKVQADKLNADNKAFERCVTDYHNARKAMVDEHNAIAVANANAAKKVDQEFNNYLDILNANLAARDKAASKAE